jgi:hypothetical protein
MKAFLTTSIVRLVALAAAAAVIAALVGNCTWH